MFTFIKKVIKTGTATHSYPLEPMPVDKNFRGKPEHNPQQCIGCAACVNACPSNALTVETDLAANQLGWQFNLGRCIFCGRCEEVCPTAAIRLSQEYELAVWKKEDFLQQSRFCHLPLSGMRTAVRRTERDRLRHRAAQTQRRQPRRAASRKL
ncbi:formate hydrogenlyase complex 3 iron-sulfur protein [Klebsiella grimontii]|uniref:Formate hydrogenlyase complex 3 iron-sulfur protein n=1 Tax=Klebsiella grimontii TaxID=2058152 RepID=A0A7H4NY64_9ENTR|nr:formate hydrogenlyase complex 3 iron-sulfur protein [Klebsiella grimontii]